MSILIDHLGATIVGGIVIMVLLAVTLNLQAVNRDIVMDNIVQTTIADVSLAVESDLLKIGYRVPRTSARILATSPSSITFLSDIDNNGSIDTVRYYLGDALELAQTPNPTDKPLYRVLNGQTLKGSSFGCTDFQLAFYDSVGQVAATEGQIREIGVRIAVQSKVSSGQAYSGTFWQSLIKPMNLGHIHL